MRTQIISTLLLVLVYIFNYLSSSGEFWADMANLAQVFPFPYMPPGWTFMIAWTSIYVALWVYLMFSWSKTWQTSKINKTISPRFWASCLLNILWITATAMERYVISVALIVWLFVLLWSMVRLLSDSSLTKKESWYIRFPFGLYYGWISLATSIIAVSQLVYQRNVELPLGQTWTIIVVGTWLLVATYSRLTWRNIWQLLISLLAFIGIASVLF